MKKETLQIAVGVVILIVFLVIVGAYYTSTRPSIPPRTTTTSPLAISCSDKGKGAACVSQSDCKEGQTLEECCNDACKLIEFSRGICEKGYDCKANECCCYCV